LTDKAKVKLEVLDSLAHRRNGKYIVVAGITPTPLGGELQPPVFFSSSREKRARIF
jgi:hypothetical protein